MLLMSKNVNAGSISTWVVAARGFTTDVLDRDPAMPQAVHPCGCSKHVWFVGSGRQIVVRWCTTGRKALVGSSRAVAGAGAATEGTAAIAPARRRRSFAGW